MLPAAVPAGLLDPRGAGGAHGRSPAAAPAQALLRRLTRNGRAAREQTVPWPAGPSAGAGHHTVPRPPAPRVRWGSVAARGSG